MCGLWGFNGEPDWQVLYQVIKAAEDRGGHSSGFFGITKSGDQKYIKGVRLDAEQIVEMALDCNQGIGHARLATQGPIDVLNAQPFVAHDMAVVHNGTIPNYLEVMRELDYTPYTENDSEAVIPLLRARRRVEGAYLLLRLTGDRRVNFQTLKNGLPLFHKTINGTGYYCSKPWHQEP